MKRLPNRNTNTSVIFSVTDILRRKFRNNIKIEEINNAKIKSVSDNYGNTVVPDSILVLSSSYCKTDNQLNVGEIMTFKVDAKNNRQNSLEYSIDVDYKNVLKWQSNNELKLVIDKNFISKFCQIRINVRSVRSYQAMSAVDSSVIFSYKVV